MNGETLANSLDGATRAKDGNDKRLLPCKRAIVFDPHQCRCPQPCPACQFRKQGVKQ